MSFRILLVSLSLFSTMAQASNNESVRSGNGGRSGSGGSGSGSASSAGGKCNIKPDEKKCGSSPDFGDKFAKTAWDNANGDRSGGKCLKGVRESFQDACKLPETPSWGVVAAADSGSCFNKAGFKEHKGNDPLPAPPKPGTVFVYEGGEYGHIEVYTGNQKDGKATYCSDYCTNTRRDVQSPGARRLANWYEPESNDDSTPMASFEPAKKRRTPASVQTGLSTPTLAQLLPGVIFNALDQI